MWRTRLKELLIGEEDFREKMDSVVEPLLKEKMVEGYFTDRDKVSVHYAYMLHPREEAAVVISHGFCEFICKYHEVMYYLYEMGYSVFYMDHRGHGFSGGKLEDPDCVYIDTYDSYVEDLKQYVHEVVLDKSSSKNLYLFAHSMGGCIGALFLEKYPAVFQKAVLSSPMMEMSYGRFSVGTVRFLCMGATVLHRLKHYIAGQHGFDGVRKFENSSMLSEERYEYVFRYREAEPSFRTYGASVAWIKAGISACRKLRRDIGNISIPVFLCQAGQDSMVLPWAQEYATEHNPNIALKKFPASKHEIFNATPDIREEYYMLVFQYFKE